MLVKFYQTTRRHVQDDSARQSHRRENFKSKIMYCEFMKFSMLERRPAYTPSDRVICYEVISLCPLWYIPYHFTYTHYDEDRRTFHLQDTSHNILGDDCGNVSTVVAFLHGTGFGKLFNRFPFSSNLSHYVFLVILRFLLVYIQPVLLGSFNKIFVALSVEVFFSVFNQFYTGFYKVRTTLKVIQTHIAIDADATLTTCIYIYIYIHAYIDIYTHLCHNYRNGRVKYQKLAHEQR
jgi:hypothetical protein